MCVEPVVVLAQCESRVAHSGPRATVFNVAKLNVASSAAFVRLYPLSRWHNPKPVGYRVALQFLPDTPSTPLSGSQPAHHTLRRT